MSLTFYLMLIAALALSVVLLAALAIYWHAEARVEKEVTRMATEAQIKAQAKYDAENTRQVHLKLNRRTDDDVLEKLDSVPSKQGYIKELIRADLAKK